MGKRIEVVEYTDSPEQFVKNCFLPAQVLAVDFEDSERGLVAHVDVKDEDRGIAIGKEGKNIFKAKKLSMRQHNVQDVLLSQQPERLLILFQQPSSVAGATSEVP